MKKLLIPIAAAILGGCTSAMLIDVSNGDVLQYRYAPWQNGDIEEASQRVRYWCYEGPRHYPTNDTLRLELRLYNGTNEVKDATYEFSCNAEALEDAK